MTKMLTQPAKSSPLGESYHYHETGDGPDFNTTDSVIDNGLHDHGLATGIATAVDTSKATGKSHKHRIPAGWRPGPNVRL